MHPWKELKGEYEHRASAMRITRPKAVDSVVAHIAPHIERFVEMQKTPEIKTVPWQFVCATLQRESDLNFKTYLGNGEPLGRKTRLVPKGRGPFETWEAGVVDALVYDHMTDPDDFDGGLPRILFQTEAWNGFGPRNHGRATGYVWAGTDQYIAGKYVADGIWDPTAIDAQLGTAAILWGLARRFPQYFRGLEPAAEPAPPPDPLLQPTPDWAGGGGTAAATQRMLNALGYDPRLMVDNSLGRLTRAGVRWFQSKNKDITGAALSVDGWPGPKTRASMEAELMRRQAAAP